MKSENKTVSETAKTVTISIEEYETLQKLKAENARLNQQVQWLLEGIKLSRKKLFGASSIYGSISIVAFTMLWLYFCMCIFFYGAALNRYVSAPKKNS